MGSAKELERNIKNSFAKAREEIEQLKNTTRAHSDYIEQLLMNQNALLKRLEEIEELKKKEKQ